MIGCFFFFAFEASAFLLGFVVWVLSADALPSVDDLPSIEMLSANDCVATNRARPNVNTVARPKGETTIRLVMNGSFRDYARSTQISGPVHFIARFASEATKTSAIGARIGTPLG